MMQRLAGLKIAAICLCFVALLACSKKSTPSIGGNASPGSVEDFQVNVGDRVYFQEDQSSLTAEAQETLRKQAAWLRQYPSVTVQVEGHADERGTREYNIALSARRATAAREFLIAQGCRQAHRLNRLWQGTSGRHVRCRTVLFAEPARSHRDHRRRQGRLS